MNMQVQNFTSATAIPAQAANVAQPDPIIALVKQRFAEEAIIDAGDIDAKDHAKVSEAAYQRAVAVDQQLMLLRPVTVEGAIASLERVRHEFETFFDDGLDGSKIVLNLLDGALNVFKASAMASIAAPTDPVFAAIEEFKAVAATYEAYPDYDDTSCRIWAERCKKSEALTAILPTTVEGKRQQLQVLRGDEEGCFIDDGSQFLRAMLAIVNDQLGTDLTIPH